MPKRHFSKIKETVRSSDTEGGSQKDPENEASRLLKNKSSEARQSSAIPPAWSVTSESALTDSLSRSSSEDREHPGNQSDLYDLDLSSFDPLESPFSDIPELDVRAEMEDIPHVNALSGLFDDSPLITASQSQEDPENTSVSLSNRSDQLDQSTTAPLKIVKRKSNDSLEKKWKALSEQTREFYQKKASYHIKKKLYPIAGKDIAQSKKEFENLAFQDFPQISLYQLKKDHQKTLKKRGLHKTQNTQNTALKTWKPFVNPESKVLDKAKLYKKRIVSSRSKRSPQTHLPEDQNDEALQIVLLNSHWPGEENWENTSEERRQKFEMEAKNHLKRVCYSHRPSVHQEIREAHRNYAFRAFPSISIDKLCKTAYSKSKKEQKIKKKERHLAGLKTGLSQKATDQETQYPTPFVKTKDNGKDKKKDTKKEVKQLGEKGNSPDPSQATGLLDTLPQFEPFDSGEIANITEMTHPFEDFDDPILTESLELPSYAYVTTPVEGQNTDTCSFLESFKKPSLVAMDTPKDFSASPPSPTHKKRKQAHQKP